MARASWAAWAARISCNLVSAGLVPAGITSGSTAAGSGSAWPALGPTALGGASVTRLTAGTSPVSLSVPARIILCHPLRDTSAACQRSAAAESRSSGRLPSAGRSSVPTSPTWARLEEPPTSTLGPHSTKPARAWSNSWAKASGTRSRTAPASWSERPSAAVSQRAPRHCSGRVKNAKDTNAASRFVSAVTGGSDASAAALDGPSLRRRSLCSTSRAASQVARSTATVGSEIWAELAEALPRERPVPMATASAAPVVSPVRTSARRQAIGARASKRVRKARASPERAATRRSGETSPEISGHVRVSASTAVS